MAEGNTLVSVDYEIFGKVQRVFFRKYTQEIVKYCVMIFKDTKDRFIWIHLRVVLAKGKGKDQAEGKKLGLVGWVQNTDRGTVQGQLQGPISKVRSMQEWLEKRGSPKSHIDRANFNNEKVISKLDYSDFQIVK